MEAVDYLHLVNYLRLQMKREFKFSFVSLMLHSYEVVI